MNEKEIFNILFEGASFFNTFLNFMNLDVIKIDTSSARKYLIVYEACLTKFENIDYIKFKLELERLVEWINEYKDIVKKIQSISKSNYNIKLKDLFNVEIEQFFSGFNVFTLKDLSEYNYDEKNSFTFISQSKKIH